MNTDGQRKPTFRDFWNEHLDLEYDWFIGLYFPPPTKGITDTDMHARWKWAEWNLDGLEMLRKLEAKRNKCVRRWIGELNIHAAHSDYSCVNVTEDRPDFSRINHILLEGYRQEHLADCDWYQRWREISGGFAFDRDLNGRVGGLMNFFVMKRRCSMEIDTEQLSGTYRADNFFVWKSREEWLREKNGE